MSQGSELERLEAIVNTLLGQFSDIKAENRRLEEELNEKTALIARLEESRASMNSERGDISSRVSELITKIEHWEVAEEVATASSTVEEFRSNESDEEVIRDQDDSSESRQGSLFTVDKE